MVSVRGRGDEGKGSVLAFTVFQNIPERRLFSCC